MRISLLTVFLFVIALAVVGHRQLSTFQQRLPYNDQRSEITLLQYQITISVHPPSEK